MTDKLLLTNSMLGGVKRCRYRAYLTYKQLLSTKARGIPLRRGSGVHKFLELFYQGVKDPQLLSNAALKEYREGIEEAKPWMTDKDIAKMMKEESLVGGWAYGYVEQFEDDLDHWDVLGVEHQVRLSIQHPDTGAIHPYCDYGCTLDLVVRDKQTNLVHLVEHKTTSQANDLYFKKLVLDPQLSGYWLACLALGLDIQDVVYNVLVVPGIRQKKNEEREEYYERLREELLDNPDKYFIRQTITRTREQLHQFMTGLWNWADEMARLWESGPDKWVRSDIVACTDFYRACEMMEPCARGLEGPHMLGFYTRDHLHPERTEDIQ